MKKNNFHYISIELMHHLPYSVAGVMAALIFMGVLTVMTVIGGTAALFTGATENLFHIFHASHLLLSAVTTTAMFWKHEKNLPKAVLVGFLGSIATCSISDVFLPFLGGYFLGAGMMFHWDVMAHPSIVFVFAGVGVLAGLAIPDVFDKSTQYSHSAHVFVSASASILYLLAFGVQDWIHVLSWVFLITIAAVMIPCCASDIVLPLTCVHKGCCGANVKKNGTQQK